MIELRAFIRKNSLTERPELINHVSSYRAFAFEHAASHCHGKLVCKPVGSDVQKAKRIYAGWYKVNDTICATIIVCDVNA